MCEIVGPPRRRVERSRITAAADVSKARTDRLFFVRFGWRFMKYTMSYNIIKTQPSSIDCGFARVNTRVPRAPYKHAVRFWYVASWSLRFVTRPNWNVDARCCSRTVGRRRLHKGPRASMRNNNNNTRVEENSWIGSIGGTRRVKTSVDRRFSVLKFLLKKPTD